MNRNQLIAKTLEEMRGYESSRKEEFYQQAAPELDEYDRYTTIPELMKRLPDTDILTCKDIDLPVGCCETCHHFYAHYDMELVDLLNGRKAWICCAVRRALFHQPERFRCSNNVDVVETLGKDTAEDFE